MKSNPVPQPTGPDPNRPGIHWLKIIKAYASDHKVSEQHAADVIAEAEPKYAAAILGSVKP